MPLAKVQHVPFWNDLAALTYQSHWGDNGVATLHNDGKNVSLQLKNYENVPSISGGPLVGTYHFHRVNFHWGVNNETGAHHLISHLPIAMEVHTSYYNSSCESPIQPQNCKTNWVIVATQFTEGPNNEAFQLIVQSIQAVREPKSSAIIKSGCLSWMKQQKTDQSYFTYKSEISNGMIVTWIIYHKPLEITEDQINIFRTALKENGEPMLENVCNLPINPLEKEIVFVRDNTEKTNSLLVGV